MIETAPKRQPVATLISLYEMSVVFIVLFLNHLSQMSRATHPSVPYYPPTALQTGMLWVSSVLAFAAGVALWQMRRSAFPLLIARFCVGVVGFVLGRVHPSIPLHRTTTLAIYLFSAVTFSVSVAIVRYVNRITSRQAEP